MSETEVRILTTKVDKILGYLHNDQGTGEKGLIADFKDHKKEFSEFKTKYETAQAVKKATIGVWATIGGVVAFIAKWVVGLFINHFHL